MKSEELQEKANNLARSGEFDEARNLLKQAIELDSSNAWNFLFLGNCHYALKEYSLALDFYKTATSLLPDDPTPYWCQGDVYRSTGELKTAKELYDKALSIDPDDENAIKGLKKLKEMKKISLGGKISIILAIVMTTLVIIEAYGIIPPRYPTDPNQKKGPNYPFRGAITLMADPNRTGFCILPFGGIESHESCGGQLVVMAKPNMLIKQLLKATLGVLFSACLTGYLIAFIVRILQKILKRKSSQPEDVGDSATASPPNP